MHGNEKGRYHTSARDRSFTVACIHNIYHCLLVTVDYYAASLVQGLPVLQGGWYWPKWLFLLQCLTGMVNYNIFRWWHTWTDDVVCKLWTLKTKTTGALVLVRLTQHLYMKLSPLDATYCMWLASNLFHSPLVYCLEVIIVRDHLVTMSLFIVVYWCVLNSAWVRLHWSILILSLFIYYGWHKWSSKHVAIDTVTCSELYYIYTDVA